MLEVFISTPAKGRFITDELNMWKLFVLPVFVVLAAPAFADLKASAPSRVCPVLEDQGLKARKWTDYGDGTTGCASNPKPIGIGTPEPNNLVFYANGHDEGVESVKLVLNYNQLRATDVKESTKALTAASQKLAIRMLGSTLPASVVTALNSGRNATEEVGSGKVQIVRQNRPSGKGYEVQVIMQ